LLIRQSIFETEYTVRRVAATAWRIKYLNWDVLSYTSIKQKEVGVFSRVIQMKTNEGFTLIELMIAVAIVTILASIAYPSYQSHLVKARRSAAQGHLMDIAQMQQRYLLDARSYAPDMLTLNMTTPNDVSSYYTIAITNTPGPPPTFTATATPKAGTSQASDVPLSIDNVGVKMPTNIW
jgi:type IV pilus assembly protein PilE